MSDAMSIMLLWCMKNKSEYYVHTVYSLTMYPSKKSVDILSILCL